MSSHENKELGKLIDINEDACAFYKSALQKTQSSQIKEAFQDLEIMHKEVVVDLQNYVRNNNADFEYTEAAQTMVGQAQKFWGELMANASREVDETLISHLQKAEERCFHSVEDVLDSEDISEPAKNLLQNQKSVLQKSHGYIQSLKESVKAA